MRRFSRSALALTGVAVLAPALSAQFGPGESILTVATGTNPVSSAMFVVDHANRTATQLTISPTLDAAGVNCVFMLAPNFGFVGTNTTGEIYQIAVSGTTVTETLLSTTASAGANVSQIVFVGSELYFTTQGGAAGGVLQKVPLGGGPVTQVLDLGNVGAVGLANAVAELNGKIYVATFDSGTTAGQTGEIVEFDPATSSTVVTPLPASIRTTSAGVPYNPGIVNMHPNPLRPGTLALAGVFGDYLVFDPATASFVEHAFTGSDSATVVDGQSNLVNSVFFDPARNDWVVGSRDGHVERWVDGHSAEKIISLGDPTWSVNGVWHLPDAGGTDLAVGGGCEGNGGFTLSDVSSGSLVAGNANFAFRCYSGVPGDSVVLLIGADTLASPLDLGLIGAPGCLLRVGTIVGSLASTLAGGAVGEAQAAIGLSLPGSASGVQFTRQWVAVQSTRTNRRGIVLSNARRGSIQ